MQSTAEFQVFFETVLKPDLQKLEDYRLKRMSVFKWFRNSAIITGIIVLIIFFLVDNHVIIAFSILALVFTLGLCYETLTKTNLQLIKEYKNRVLPKILEFINPECRYIPNQKIAKTVLSKSLLFPREVNIVKGEDYMQFRINDVDIMFCESEVYGYRPGYKMFDRIFISATFNKEFTSRTFIFPEKTTGFFRKLRFRILGASYNVKLEDPEFEKEFIVLGEDQVESRYILTTSLMQRILEYKKKVKAEMAFSFIQNRLYCTIPDARNLFEPAIFDSFLDFSFILKSYEPIILYTAIVNDLNLNLRIWSKI